MSKATGLVSGRVRTVGQDVSLGDEGLPTMAHGLQVEVVWKLVRLKCLPHNILRVLCQRRP